MGTRTYYIYVTSYYKSREIDHRRPPRADSSSPFTKVGLASCVEALGQAHFRDPCPLLASEVLVAKAMEDAHSAHSAHQYRGSTAAATAQATVPRAQAPVPRQKKTKITRFSPDAAPVVSPRGRSYKPIADALTGPSGPLEVRSYEGGISTHTPDNGRDV